jgi:tripartite-type tricarboxylate transporter receptor subunit TctC
MTASRMGLGLAAVAVFSLTALLPSGAQAQSVAEFYRGRTVNFIVGSGAGGGYDTYMRMLARFFPKHIPGEPNIVVQNMPGAGSRVALNYMYNRAARDGSVVSDSDSIMPFSGLFEADNTRFDPREFGWLGSMGKQISICAAWHASPFHTVDDVMTKPMRVSGTGAAGWRITLPKIFNAIAGSKLVPVAGYTSTEAMLAVERGEVDGICPTYDTLIATKPQWLEQKKIRLVLQFALEQIPGLEGVPSGLDQIKDKMDRSAMELILSQQETGHPVATPPGVPADRLAALRAAFEATMKDPAFLAESKRSRLMIDPIAAGPMEALIKNAYGTDPAVIERAKALLALSAKN